MHACRSTLEDPTLAAAVGLVIIGLAPMAYQSMQNRDPTPLEISTLAAAYGLLAVTSPRHVMLYRTLAVICGEANIGFARRLIALGWVKTIYEGIWLACCSLALFAAAAIKTMGPRTSDDLVITLALCALFGAMGFSVVWIWMIIAHARLFLMTKRTK